MIVVLLKYTKFNYAPILEIWPSKPALHPIGHVPLHIVLIKQLQLVLLNLLKDVLFDYFYIRCCTALKELYMYISGQHKEAT